MSQERNERFRNLLSSACVSTGMALMALAPTKQLLPSLHDLPSTADLSVVGFMFRQPWSETTPPGQSTSGPDDGCEFPPLELLSGESDESKFFSQLIDKMDNTNQQLATVVSQLTDRVQAQNRRKSDDPIDGVAKKTRLAGLAEQGLAQFSTPMSKETVLGVMERQLKQVGEVRDYFKADKYLNFVRVTGDNEIPDPGPGEVYAAFISAKRTEPPVHLPHFAGSVGMYMHAPKTDATYVFNRWELHAVLVSANSSSRRLFCSDHFRSTKFYQNTHRTSLASLSECRNGTIKLIFMHHPDKAWVVGRFFGKTNHFFKFGDVPTTVNIEKSSSFGSSVEPGAKVLNLPPGFGVLVRAQSPGGTSPGQKQYLLLPRTNLPMTRVTNQGTTSGSPQTTTSGSPQTTTSGSPQTTTSGSLQSVSAGRTMSVTSDLRVMSSPRSLSQATQK